MFKRPNTKIYSLTTLFCVAVALISAFLTSCGGANSNLGNVSLSLSGNLINVGIFRDSNVTGLAYETPTQIGVTGTDGKFEYQVNESVTFSVGGVTIGTTRALPVMSPVDLATLRGTDSAQAQNIARFLIMLDEDADPDNGIVISQEIQDIAATWPQVDFTTTDLDTELINILSDVNSIYGSIPNRLPDADTAKTHLDDTLLCTYSGAFQGQLAGGDSGHIAFAIEPNNLSLRTGQPNGFVFSNNAQILQNVIGPAIQFLSTSFAQPTATAGSRTYTIRFTSLDAIDGNWSDPAGAAFGTFTGARVAAGQDFSWHFAGTYRSDEDNGDVGVVEFDLVGADADSVIGAIFSMLSGGAQFAINGNLTAGTTFAGSSSDGKQWNGNIIIDPAQAGGPAYGLMSGTWTGATGETGTFNGSGCKRF